jgi:predicted DsbA family dithiol-disulfide isomerase
MTDVLTKPIQIDLVADVVCPYCFLGWGRLKQALGQRPNLQTEVVWRPFQLNPDMPAGGLDSKTHMARIIPDPAGVKRAHDALTQQGKTAGVEFNFDKVLREPNTNGAHRVIMWAASVGKQAEAIEAMFAAHFTDGKFIGAVDVLGDVAASIGMDRDVVVAKLTAGDDADAVRTSHRMAAQAGVTGVPCTIFNNKFALMGAEMPDRYVMALDKAAAEG